MVADITVGYPTDDKGRPYRRRRHAPAAIAMAVLLVIGLIIWVRAFASDSDEGTPSACNPPTGTPSATSTSTPGDGAAPTATPAQGPGEPANRQQMLDVAPAALSMFQVRVLNASTERGAAQRVLNDLTQQGFAPASQSAFGDDPLYPDQNLNCYGQIRFGTAGKAAAAAVWIASPCMELVVDKRQGTDVDLVLGRDYKSEAASQDAIAVLSSLQTANPNDKNANPDQTLVRAVHETVRC